MNKKTFNTNFMLINHEKELQNKIAKEFNLPISDNSSELVSDYDKKEFDEWIDDLGKKNGYTLY